MNAPKLMGILNVTPDSFSGDGVLAEQAAVTKAQALVAAGADIIDVGAESTRPGAMPLSQEEEWERLAPVLTHITAQPWRSKIRLSVDTRHAATAAQALALGVEIINDVGGLSDDGMCALLAQHACDVVVMHSLTIPADKAVILPPGCDPVAEILAWKKQTLKCAETHTVAANRLIFDPGIGFGKTPEQSLALILAAGQLKASGGRWLFGHSRKSFLHLFTPAPAAERDPLTLAFSAQLAAAGIDYLRVHAVAEHRALFEWLCI